MAQFWGKKKRNCTINTINEHDFINCEKWKTICTCFVNEVAGNVDNDGDGQKEYDGDNDNDGRTISNL